MTLNFASIFYSQSSFFFSSCHFTIAIGFIKYIKHVEIFCIFRANNICEPTTGPFNSHLEM